MTSLLQQIHESADEHIVLVETVVANIHEAFSGFSNENIIAIVESAAKYLGQISAQLKFNRQLSDLDKAIGMLTALRVLGSSENRDAFNIRQNTFKVLIQKAGEDANVDAALLKLANNPSVAGVRQQIETMLNDALQKGDNELRVALTNVNKLRLGYERVQGMLQSGADGSSAVSQNTDGGAKAQSKPTSAWTNPAARQPASRNAPANNNTTATTQR